MRSRRTVLASLGTVGVVGLSGCSTLSFGDEGREDVSLPAEAVESIAWPDSPFPVAIPPSFADTHRERIRELLAAVPADPSVPNRAVAEELRGDREHVARRVSEDADRPWPTERLSRWRYRRSEAATVRGAYRAATGEDDAATVAERRRAVRDDLGSFDADHEYRASTSIEAVLVHTPIEELITDCRRYVRPDPAYPPDPIARPFRAGDVVGDVERARAAIGDARRLRAAYVSERTDPPSQWSTLIDASNRLRHAVFDARSTIDEFLDLEESPFEADLEGTVGRHSFLEATRRVESMVEGHEFNHRDGEYAAAVIVAGRALTAIEVLRTTIDEIRDGAHQGSVTVESVTRTAERAREAIGAIEASEDRRLAAHIALPALGGYRYLSENVGEGYVDATRVQGDLVWAERYARVVPAATAFVIGRLE